jgi:hypothetical protein
MPENKKKRSYAIMAHDQEHHNKSPAANDNDNQAYHTDGREPAITTTNNDMAIHDHVVTTAADKPQDGEAKDEEAKDGEAKGADQVNIADDSAASVSDGGDTAVAQDGGGKTGEEGEDASASSDDEFGARAGGEGEDNDAEDQEDEDMEDDEGDEEEEEEAEDEDPNHVNTYLPTFLTPDHAALAIDHLDWKTY